MTAETSLGEARIVVFGKSKSYDGELIHKGTGMMRSLTHRGNNAIETLNNNIGDIYEALSSGEWLINPDYIANPDLYRRALELTERLMNGEDPYSAPPAPATVTPPPAQPRGNVTPLPTQQQPAFPSAPLQRLSAQDIAVLVAEGRGKLAGSTKTADQECHFAAGVKVFTNRDGVRCMVMVDYNGNNVLGETVFQNRAKADDYENTKFMNPYDHNEKKWPEPMARQMWNAAGTSGQTTLWCNALVAIKKTSKDGREFMNFQRVLNGAKFHPIVWSTTLEGSQASDETDIPF